MTDYTRQPKYEMLPNWNEFIPQKGDRFIESNGITMEVLSTSRYMQDELIIHVELKGKYGVQDGITQQGYNLSEFRRELNAYKYQFLDYDSEDNYDDDSSEPIVKRPIDQNNPMEVLASKLEHDLYNPNDTLFEFDTKSMMVGIMQQVSLPKDAFTPKISNVALHDPVSIDTIAQECSHTWDTYKGLFGDRDFCTKCDQWKEGL